MQLQEGNMNRLVTAGVAAVFAAVTGCATNPEKIQAASVSALPYMEYNCNQIGLELDRVTKRADELHTRLKKLADDDAAQMAIGMLLFWPALFFLEGGDGPEAAEYARVKGERDVLQKIAVDKNCPRELVPTLHKPATQPEEGEKASEVPAKQ
jgi:hypothetical protein